MRGPQVRTQPLQLHTASIAKPGLLSRAVPVMVTCLHSVGRWRQVLDEHVVKERLLFCRVTQNRAFDTEAATSSYATGFVVDEDLGIILTNRHVVSAGMPRWLARGQCRALTRLLI